MSLDDVTEGIFQEKGELASAFEHFDSNKENSDGSNSSDQNSNLSDDDIGLMTALDCLKRMKIFPDIGLTNQMKLLRKSGKQVGGWNINKKVELAVGQREHQSGGGMMGKFSNLFKSQA